MPPSELEAWANRLGFEELVNARGPTWRKIPQAERAHLTAATAIALLRAHPSAIKRPILEAGSTLLLGFDPEAFARAQRR